MPSSGSILRVIVAASVFAIGVDANAPSACSLDSDLQILLHNDLYGEESTRTSAVIVLDSEQSQSQAASSCSALGESLWTPPTDLSSNDFLKYLTYNQSEEQGSGQWSPGPKSRYHHHQPWSHEQLYFVEGAAGKGGCLAISPSGQTKAVSCSAKLPALCTQSAALSGINETDTSARFQTAVSSGDAIYTGYRDKLSFRFLGIQYADYPQRFTYSSPVQAKGEVSALEFGSICRQVDAVTNVNDGSEDCLHLNIYSPYLPKAASSDKKLKPVMFWIHGGAFINGYGSDPTFDGGNLASRGDVVVVTINYRLGDFGWLTFGNGTGLNGNYGISDQVSALQWVHDNIAAFGGDPNQVTIWGQSAGAGSVRALLQSPPASGLFSAAILESDPTQPTYSYYLTVDQETTTQTTRILNLTSCASGKVDDEIACLRNYNGSELVSLSTVANNVVVDGKYVVEPAIAFNGTGSVNKVPLLLGTMRDDGAPGLDFLQTTNLTLSLSNNSLPITPATNLSATFPLPPSSNTTTAIWNVTAEVSTDLTFRCLDLATAYAAAKTSVFYNVHYYQFDRSYQIPYWPTAYPNKELCNAPVSAAFPAGNPEAEYYKCHSGDLTIIFSTWRRWGLPERDANDTPFTQYVIDSWTSWARTHDPNPDPAYLETRGYVNTTAALAASGAWQPVSEGGENPTLRSLQWPVRQESFGHDEQCAALGQGLDYFL